MAIALLAAPAGAERGTTATEIPLEDSDVQRFAAPNPNDLTAPEIDLPPVELAVDDADDPPALLGDKQLAGVQSIARNLSSDRGWLRDEILTTLAEQDLRLDEIFVDAPELVFVGAGLYRVQVERIGSGWRSFDAAVDGFFVALSHEIYEGHGSDRALGYIDGAETVIFEADLETSPGFLVTLIDVPAHEGLSGEERVASITDEIALGAAELRLTLDRLPIHLFRDLHAVAGPGQHFSVNDLRSFTEELQRLQAESATAPTSDNSCTQEVASLSCSAGKPACTAGYSPYFVMTQIKIKQDHEGAFKGNPEIELFPMRIDVASPLGSNTTASTNLWFYGQNVTDMAGRTRYLPDVNDVNSWYSITNGVAIFPATVGKEFSALLVEQDDDRGVLRVKSTKINVTKLVKDIGTLFDYRSIDASFLFKLAGVILDIIGLFNDGDDLFQESIGIASSKFCADSVGQMKTYYLTSQEWEMKGHFACINPSCPDPGTGGGGGGGTPPFPGGCLIGGDVVCP